MIWRQKLEFGGFKIMHVSKKRWDVDEVLQGMIENDVVDYGMEGHMQLDDCGCIKYVIWCYELEMG